MEQSVPHIRRFVGELVIMRDLPIAAVVTEGNPFLLVGMGFQRCP